MSMVIGVRSRTPKPSTARFRRAGAADLAVLLTVGSGAVAQAQPGNGQNPAEEVVLEEILDHEGQTDRTPSAGAVNRPAAEVKPASGTRTTQTLPATGATGGLALQSSSGILMVGLGALVLLGRRRTPHELTR